MLKSKIGFEVLWWIITVVLIGLVLLPIYNMIGDNYPFYLENILIIIISVTFSRFIFFLQHHWVANSKWFKIFFIFIPIPIFFFLIDVFYDFQTFSDQKSIYSIMNNLTASDQTNLGKYIRTEMLLFWAMAFLCTAYLPIRMIKSLYRKINKGTH